MQSVSGLTLADAIFNIILSEDGTSSWNMHVPERDLVRYTSRSKSGNDRSRSTYVEEKEKIMLLCCWTDRSMSAPFYL